ncbi:hypothetical protein [Actinoplanes siamensis]|uniref:Uncharacterized protein n=1 Tax=Actinoplanes siamensis TaxID=1223317 RepID=A0A919TP63_9ACTN|nr:hypothetical protein [Actinoplanes siamensis]GIF08858.1 hypothetical protein Asi03nite_63960 [Actinoplanes siamensis]
MPDPIGPREQPDRLKKGVGRHRRTTRRARVTTEGAGIVLRSADLCLRAADLASKHENPISERMHHLIGLVGRVGGAVVDWVIG